MELFLKASACIAVFVLLLGFCIHHPIHADIPDRMEFQTMVDVLAVSETAARLSEWCGCNRWWAYPGNLQVFFPYSQSDNLDIKYMKFAGTEAVIITPKAFKSRVLPGPAIVFYHGGGWVFGNIRTHIKLLMQAAEETGLVVFSPDYRKAPQYPFPVPYEDCLNSTLNFMKQAKQFNVDPDNLILAGDSAGGNLAMSVALELLRRNKKNPSIHTPKMMTLLYPILQMGNFLLPSHQQNYEFVFSKTLLPKFWLAYIGLNNRLDLAEIVAQNGHINQADAKLIENLKVVSGDAVPEKYKERGYNATVPLLTKKQKLLLNKRVLSRMQNSLLNSRIAPLMVNDDELSMLPQTHILVCEYDAIRDDGVILYERLKRLNKSVTLQYLPNSLHASATVGSYFPYSYYGTQNKVFFDYISQYIK